jgi:uncharacterized membrane protein
VSSENQLEGQLARIYGAGLGVAILFFAVGLFLRPMLWAGMLCLALVVPVAAGLVWRSADRETRISIALSSLGVIAAIAIGLLLRK